MPREIKQQDLTANTAPQEVRRQRKEALRAFKEDLEDIAKELEEMATSIAVEFTICNGCGKRHFPNLGKKLAQTDLVRAAAIIKAMAA